MCDYSLMAVPNRLAQEGEQLVTHRFPTGSLGLASPVDIARVTASASPSRKSFFTVLKEFFNPPAAAQVCAVCIPPGARLRLNSIPQRLQQAFGVGLSEEVTFTQLSEAVNTYRDAVRFGNGRELRLQELREGMAVTVLDLSAAEEVNLDVLRFEREFVHRR